MQIALMDRIADFVPKRGEWAYLGRLSFFVFTEPWTLCPVPWALGPVPGAVRRLHDPDQKAHLGGEIRKKTCRNMKKQGDGEADPDEPDGDLEGKADDEYVHLGDGTRNEPQAEIGKQQRHDDRRRDLNGDDEHVPGQIDKALRQCPRHVEPEDRQHRIALRYGLDHHVMAVDNQEEKRRKEVLELGDDGDLVAREGVDDVGDGEPHLEAYEVTGHPNARKSKTTGKTQDDPDEDLAPHSQAEREKILGAGGRVPDKGKNEKGDENCQPPLDAGRGRPFPEYGDHHHDGADPEQNEKEELDLPGGEVGKRHVLTGWGFPGSEVNRAPSDPKP